MNIGEAGGLVILGTRSTMAASNSGDGLPIYLREVNRTPLLSPQEERELGRRVTRGDADARDLLIRANLRLVISLARGHLGRGLSLEDLISEGNLGLIRAVEGFDPEAGLRLSTYAVYWIKQSMRNAVINQGRPLRLPIYMITLLAKWRRAGAVLAERLGRPPTPQEIGKVLKLSKRQMRVVAQAIRVDALKPLGEDKDEDKADWLLVDERSRDVCEAMIEADEMERLTRDIGDLPEPLSRVIRMRFGLDPYVPMTLREIGEALGISHEAVRKAERDALRRLAAGPG